ALLGMSRREVQRKFDAIVAFSEIEPFIDVQVKHYSSGMFARLAFAVNIHVEPDILLVDEVLAVGDAAFQRKCLQRIEELRSQGVTVFFVSHALDTVRKLCSR
ncbi:MAG: sugar ABC transporter ATP-binding protein, partial [Abditibacteriales bacterium]|nr:sugar ABC transporter ATP-binding protein [Abditibacteriales bacterium]